MIFAAIYTSYLAELIVWPEFFVVFDVFFVIYWNKVAFVVELVESIFLVANMIDKENAVEMVDFVQDSAREKAFGFEFDFGAVFELCLNAGLGRARNLAVNSWDGETTFVVAQDATFGFDDDGVDKGNKVVVAFFVKIFADKNNAAVIAELRCGDCGREFVLVFFFPCQRSLGHLTDNLADFVVDFGDRGRYLA